MNSPWYIAAADFLRSLLIEKHGAASSVPAGPLTLYGTCYSFLALHYLGRDLPYIEEALRFVVSCQDPTSGLLVGPELISFQAKPGVLHDFEHLAWHSTCAALPYCQEFNVSLANHIKKASSFCDSAYLERWLNARDWKCAWFEGNNILFVGQVLVHMRDVEGNPKAQAALDKWFRWLEQEVDPLTSLWGTQGFCSAMDAVYGGYHQLLVYWHEGRQVPNPEGLVDTVLSLRHPDGGFNPNGNGGACEDVDSVDILVNCYKRWDYRRAEIRRALWRCADHILATQNSDGGFPYNRNQRQSHMGIPGTEAEPNVSCTFPTWFRIHTLALCHEIIPEHPQLEGVPFCFNKCLSMGWHRSPPDWKLEVPDWQRKEEAKVEALWRRQKRVHYFQERAMTIRKRLIGLRNNARITAGGIKNRLLG